jgi:hypothetical protein
MWTAWGWWCGEACGMFDGDKCNCRGSESILMEVDAGLMVENGDVDAETISIEGTEHFGVKDLSDH